MTNISGHLYANSTNDYFNSAVTSQQWQKYLSRREKQRSVKTQSASTLKLISESNNFTNLSEGALIWTEMS